MNKTKEIDVEIDIKDTVPYEYYYEKRKDAVYLIYRYGNRDYWKETKTPLIELPYTTL